MSDDRRASLLRAKLAAVLAARGLTADSVTASGLCAATVGTDAWVVADQHPGKVLGPAVAFALSKGCAAVDVVIDAADTSAVGTVARRAADFRLAVRVWSLEGTVLHAADPAPLPADQPARPEHLALIEDIRAGGATPVVEHGVIAGEVGGLEVCRVVDDPVTGAVRLEVGVGAHDRETFQMLHGDRPAVQALADVVRVVAQHRAPGAAPHPLNGLAGERALRQRLIDDPPLIGATSVAGAAPPVARTNLKDPVPCVALARRDGALTTVVCSVGIDLDLIPFAADARQFHGTRDAIAVVPERDAIQLQRRIAAALQRPIEVIGLQPPAVAST